MQNRFFSTQNKPPYTLKNYRDHLALLIDEMQTSKTIPTSFHDKANADNQLKYAIDVLKNIDALLTNRDINIAKKITLGNKLSGLPKKYFPKNEVPAIEGARSKEFALKLASHYNDFLKVDFDQFTIDATKAASALGLCLSIPEQIKHQEMLVKNIENNINNYAKLSR